MSENVTFIKTPVANLRLINEGDVPFLVRLINDPEIRKYIKLVAPMMEAAEKEWVNRLAKDSMEMKNFVFIIELPDGTPVGTMGVHRINLKNRHATTGAILQKEYWGKGIGSTVKMYLLNYLFNELGLNRVKSLVWEFNERSVKYSLRCGYKIEGQLRQVLYRDGKYWDEIILGVLRDEWVPIWEKFQKNGGRFSK